MYDPNLARFVSADTIAPSKNEPQSRNRYSYVLNNPLRFTDPTGHCATGDGDNPAECAVAVTSLALLGLQVNHPEDWKYHELQQVLEGIGRLQKAAGWSDTEFKNAMTGKGTYAVFLSRTDKIDIVDETYATTIANSETKMISVIFADKAFNEGDTMTQITAVHELAHVWDAASGGILSNNMAAATGSYNGCTSYWDCYRNGIHYVPGGSAASEYASRNYREDWAEAVAASVFTDDPRYVSFFGYANMDQTRASYVQAAFQSQRN
jgi:hypothetical protein